MTTDDGTAGHVPADELTAAVAAVRAAERAAAQVDELHALLAEERLLLDELAQKLAREERDVSRLEGVSLARVVAAVRGRREEELTRERAETDAARLAVETRRYTIARLAEELDGLQRVAASGPAATARLQELLTAAESGAESAALRRNAERRGELTADITELEEALGAAVEAAHRLQGVQELLHAASGWSTYDTFFGGGLLASAVKHSRLDDATDAAAEARQSLRRLQAELADVGATADVHLPDVSAGLRAFDVWFDNVFSDVAVHTRVRDAQHDVADTARAVEAVARQMRARIDAARDELAAAEEERLRLHGVG